MHYNISFQIAGLIVVLVLAVVFFSKKRWKSLQNSIFRILLIVTILELIIDVASVITITNRQKVPILNDVISKGYLIIMISYIFLIVLYTLSNTLYKGMSKTRLLLKKIETGIISTLTLASCIIILANPLLYGGEGIFVFSYGIPSDVVYYYSTAGIIIVFITLLCNMKRIPVARQLSIYFFCVMEGVVALTQMFNKQLLIIGYGTAITVLLIYFTLENPDMNLINKLNQANEKSRKLLLNILPIAIADKLSTNYNAFSEIYEEVSVIFIDIVGFSKMSSEIGAVKTVNLLNKLFSEIDILIGNYRIEKIKTIGDAYMAAAGVPERYSDNCIEAIKFAKAVNQLLSNFNMRMHTNISIRTGINTGMVVAGVIGKKKFIYDLWGETVNLASRLESYGEPNRICVSEHTKTLCSKKYAFEKRNAIPIKGFGDTVSYFLV